MIDVVGGAKRQPGVGAIDRRGRRIDQMPAAVMAAAFQHVDEALQVGIHVGVRIGQRMAHAGLRGEMDDVGKLVRRKQRRDRARGRPDRA